LTPLSLLATTEIPPGKDSASASGLFNMMRNLGGSIGIAALATLLTWREHFHSNRLGEAVSLYSPATQERLSTMTQYFMARGADFATAQNQALKAIDGLVRREAYVMAYNDCFLFVGLALMLSGLCVFFLRKPRPGTAGGAGGH
jgi:DHA2 family multidrug resistance protein